MGKSRTYRGCNVQSVNVEVLLQGRVGQEAVVGVDVGKERLHLVLYWPDRAVSQPIVVRQPEQLGQAMQLLQRIAEGRRLRVALEPTGTYGDPFRYACHQAGLTVERVSPVASSRHAEVYDNVPSQHDGKDACTVGELAFMGKSQPWPWQEAGSETQLLAEHTALLDSSRDDLDRWRGRLEARIARHWPEVTELLELDSTTLLNLLGQYQSPRKFASDPEASAKLTAWGRGFLSAEKIAAVVASASQTRGVPVGPGDGYGIAMIARKMLAAKAEIAEHHREVERQSRQIPAVALLANPLGKATMAVVYLDGGDPAGYSSGGAYLKALGLNLVERSSGKHQGRLHISKRGSSRSRRWLYLAALRLLDEPGVSEWYRSKVARDGGVKMKGVIAVMRKLALGIHHCCSTGEEFDPRRMFQERKPRRARNRKTSNRVPSGKMSGVTAAVADN